MASKPQPSFYKRRLPSSCIAFSSRPGKEIFASALSHSGLKSFFALIQQFSTQTEPAYCGLTTLVLVLNALSVDPRQNWKGPWRWYSENMLNCCISLEDVKKSGITLNDFSCLAQCQGLTVDMTYANDDDDDDTTGIQNFRNAVRQACIETTASDSQVYEREDEQLNVLVVSYSRKVLEQTGSGHFSPIAAYDPASDQVLILDTARFKYGAHWTKLELLYQAMKPIDKDTGKSRGYALLSFAPTTSHHKPAKLEGDCCQHFKPSVQETSSTAMIQPISLLFKSKLVQSPARHKYKKYLLSLQPKQVTWDQVVDYWTESSPKNSNAIKVWNILEPISDFPNEEDQNEQQQATTDLKVLVQDMLQTFKVSSNSCTVEEHQALLVVYLASISKISRINVVKEYDSHSLLARDKILNEAALIEAAIETSDQNDLCCKKHKCCRNKAV